MPGLAVRILPAATALLGGAFAIGCGCPAAELVGAEVAMLGLAVGGAAVFVAADLRGTRGAPSARVPRGDLRSSDLAVEAVPAPPIRHRALPAIPSTESADIAALVLARWDGVGTA
jgi:hypothetical protein